MSTARRKGRGKKTRRAPTRQASADVQEVVLDLEIAEGEELALGMMLRDAEPGELVLLHDDDCPFDQPEGECDCSPLYLRTGAKA